MWSSNWASWVSDAKLISLLTVSIVGAGAFISTLEWLVNRRQLRDGGLLGFDVLGSRPLLAGPGLTARAFRNVLAYKPYCTVLLARLLAIAALPVFMGLDLQVPAVVSLAIILLTGSLIHVRTPFGLDGSDQMTTQVYGALFIALALGGNQFLKIALWYIAAQAALAYFASGAAKLFSPIWRKGGVTERVFNTRTYGFEPAARFVMRHRHVSRNLDWIAIGAETLFPLCLFVGFPFVFLFLVWGVLFHLANATIMGLNSFFWAFVSTYPAILYAAFSIQEYLVHL